MVLNRLTKIILVSYVVSSTVHYLFHTVLSTPLPLISYLFLGAGIGLLIED